jgi:hypothetical protein
VSSEGLLSSGTECSRIVKQYIILYEKSILGELHVPACSFGSSTLTGAVAAIQLTH